MVTQGGSAHQEIVCKGVVPQPVAAEGDDRPQKGLRQGRLAPARQKCPIACSRSQLHILVESKKTEACRAGSSLPGLKTHSYRGNVVLF